MSFGFSVGDFLAGAKLIADLTRVPSASKGASMEYQQLILDLHVVETTLIQIDQMRLASQLNISAMNALSWIVRSTSASVTDFMKRTKKYQQSLSAEGSGNKLQDLWMKVGWSLYKPAEIKSLHQQLQLDLGSINCLISLAVRNGSSLEAHYDYLDAGSYAQSRRLELPSYSDDDFGIIVHRRIAQEFVIGGKMANFDPKTLFLSYQLPQSRERNKPDRRTPSALDLDARVSAKLFQESNNPLGSQTTYESKVRNSFIGEAAIRRLLVVQEGTSSALCLPIQTYNGRGCADQVGKEFFGIIYTSDDVPSISGGEEEMIKTPIYVKTSHSANALHVSSRINYSKVFRVDHNVRVKDLGIVDVNSIQTLIKYFKESSIKLTKNPKFNNKSKFLKESGTEGIQDRKTTANSSTSKPPNITANDYEEKRPAIEQSSGQFTSINEFDKEEVLNDDQEEPMFDFEP